MKRFHLQFLVHTQVHANLAPSDLALFHLLHGYK